MKKAFAIAVVLVFMTSSMVWGQSSSTGKPKLAKIIQINREDIKIGKSQDHLNLVRAVRQVAESTPGSPYWITTTSLSGNTSEQMFFTMYDSYSDFAQKGEAMSRVFRTSFNTIPEATRDNIDTHLSKKGVIAELREDLSFNPERSTVADHTAWIMTTVRLKPGYSSEFADMEKSVIELHKKNNIDESWIVYQSAFGNSTPTFYVFYPLKSLSDLDNDALDKQHESVFTRDIRRGFDTLTRDAVLSQESTLISVQPELSRPDRETVAANPAFWTVKDSGPVYASLRESTKGRKSVVEPASSKKEGKN